MIYLDALTEHDCEQIRQWRNGDISAARTPYLLTDLMQKDFYKNVVSNRVSPHRYWAVLDSALHEVTQFGDDTPQYKDISLNGVKERGRLLGIAGLTNIEWENGRAEIALMIAPSERGKGYGLEAFERIKLWGFARMRLHTIYACVYGNNPALVAWWQYKCKPTEITSYLAGKFWDGQYHRIYHMTWVNEGDK